MLQAVLLIDLSQTNHLSLTAKYRGGSNGAAFSYYVVLLKSVDLSYFVALFRPAGEARHSTYE